MLPFSNPACYEDLERSLERRIHRWTGGRVRQLEVRWKTDQIIIRGQVSSYHLKQLVLSAVQDANVPPRPASLVLDVKVDNVRSRTTYDSEDW